MFWIDEGEEAGTRPPPAPVPPTTNRGLPATIHHTSPLPALTAEAIYVDPFLSGVTPREPSLIIQFGGNLSECASNARNIAAAIQGSGLVEYVLLTLLVLHGTWVSVGAWGSPVYLMAAFMAAEAIKNKERFVDAREVALEQMEQSATIAHAGQTRSPRYVLRPRSQRAKFQRLKSGRRKEGVREASVVAAENAREKWTLEGEMVISQGADTDDYDLSLSTEDVIAIVYAIKDLLVIYGGGVSVTEEQVFYIKSRVYVLPSSLPEFSQLVASLRIIREAVNSILPPSNTHIHFINTADIISTLRRTIKSSRSSFDEVQESNIDLLHDSFDNQWIRQQLVSYFCLVLANKSKNACGTLQETFDSLTANRKRDSKFDSSMTLVDPDDDIRDLVASTYLVYTNSLAKFAPVGDGKLRRAVSRMSAAGLERGDLVVILAEWSGRDTGMQPKCTFVHSHASLRMSQHLMKANGDERDEFGALVLARLDGVAEVERGMCEWTVEVLRQRHAVPFEFGGKNRLVENRVRDAFVFGAVRVGAEVVDALFD